MKNLNLRIRLSDVLFMFTMVFVLGLPGASQIKAYAIIVFFAYMMLMKLVYFRSIKNDLHLVGLVLFLGYAYLSKKWSLYPEAVDDQLSNVVWAVMSGTAVSTYISLNEYSVEDIVKRLLPVGLVFLVNVLLNGSFEDDRLSTGINANVFGRLSASMFCFLFYQCKQDRWRNRYMIVLAAIFLLLVFLSGSRTSMLIAGIYVIAFLAFEHPTKNTLKLVGRIFTGVIICAVGYMLVTRVDFLYTSIGHRVEAMIGLLTGVSGGDGSAVTRLSMIESAEQIFLASPLIGIGMNNFKYATRFDTYAHNNYYELAACLGIVGLVLYYSPMVSSAINAFNRWRNDEKAMIVPLVLLVAVLVGDFGSVSYFNPTTHVYIGLAIGLLAQQSNLTKEESGVDSK